MIRDGENIYPCDIKGFLYTPPKVQDVRVVGLPDRRWGEKLCAWIVAKPGQTIAMSDHAFIHRSPHFPPVRDTTSP